MTPEETIRTLLAEASAPAERRAARIGWVEATHAAWLKAQRQMDDYLTAIVGEVSEEEFERLCDEEEAKVDAIRAVVEDAAYNDRWPKHLYFGNL